MDVKESDMSSMIVGNGQPVNFANTTIDFRQFAAESYTEGISTDGNIFRLAVGPRFIQAMTCTMTLAAGAADSDSRR